MNQNDIRKKLNLGGSQTLVAEDEYSIDKTGRNICALLNSGGGNIVFIDSTAYKSDQEYSIYNDITPKAVLSLEKKVIDKHSALCFEVPAGKDTPYSYKNVIYVREGNETIPADIETVKDMIIKKQNEPIRWERRFSDAEYESDFDNGHFITVIDNIVKGHRFKFKRINDTIYYLEDLSLYKYGKLTNACDVLFCTNPAQRLPQIRAKAALFANDKTDSTYLDMKNFEGPLLNIFNDLFNFISRNTPTLSHFKESSSVRQDKPIYPANAIREGLINALVHRDYSDFKGSISVSIYPGRLEIWNYGELPEGITVDNLSKGNVSILRNPDISFVMYLQGYMERIGRGASLIKKLCKENGLPEPQWKSEKGRGVTLTFFAPEYRPNAGRIPADTSSKPAEPSLKPSDTDGLATDYSLENENERRISDGLATDYKKKVIDYLTKKSSITTKQAKKLLDMQDTRVKEIFHFLINDGLIERKGQGRGTYYELKQR
jgi:ATP-dependent DNA helicase RecG